MTPAPGPAFRLFVAATALATWALVGVGGAVRVSESGLGCPDWPLCNGRIVPAGEKEPVIEYAHRATAGLVVVLLLVSAAWALRRYRSRADVVVPLVFALALVPLQALLGAVVVWLELPDRIVGVHFMVGLVMLALCMCACVASWRGARTVTRTFARTAVAAAAAGLVLVSLGAGVVSTDALHACGEEWPGCNGGVVGGDGLAILQVAHRSTAYVVAALALALAVLGLRGHARLLVALPAALAAVCQIGFGVGLVLSSHGSLQHDVFRILHVAGGAGVWAALVAAASVSLLEARAPLPLRSTSPRAVRRRVAPTVAMLLAAATALPFVLGLTLVESPGGSGVVSGTIWVANEGGDSLTAIDASTHAVVTVLRGVAAPHNVQASPDGATIWATSPANGVVAIDARTLAVRGAVATGAHPAHVVVTPDGRSALVTDGDANLMTIVNSKRMQEEAAVTVGAGPHGLRPGPDGTWALVADMGGSTVSLVDVRARAVEATIEVGEGPVQVAVAPAGDVAYVTLGRKAAVVKVDLARRTVVGRAAVAPGPVQVAVTPDGATAVVASQGSAERPGATVALVDTATMRRIAVLVTGAGAHGVAVEPGGRQAFVTDVWAGDVAVIDLAARRVVDRIPVGGAPNGVSFSPLRQPHARGAANMGSAVVLTLPLGGRSGGSVSSHDHG